MVFNIDELILGIHGPFGILGMDFNTDNLKQLEKKEVKKSIEKNCDELLNEYDLSNDFENIKECLFKKIDSIEYDAYNENKKNLDSEDDAIEDDVLEPIKYNTLQHLLSLLPSKTLNEFSSILKTSLPEPKIKTISFNNFKGFGEHIQTFELKPITLIYAPNSVGKSSFLHAMIHLQYFAINHLKENSISIDKITIFGDEIDLGGFENYIHKHDINRKIKYIIIIDDYRLPYLTALYSLRKIKIKFWFNELIKILKSNTLQQIMYFFYNVLKEEYNLYSYEKNFEHQIVMLNENIDIKNKNEDDNPESEFYLIIKKTILELINNYSNIDKATFVQLFKEKIYKHYLEDIKILDKLKPLTIEYNIGYNGHESIYKIDDKVFFTHNSIDIVQKDAQKIKIAQKFDEIVSLKTIQYIGPLRYYPERNFIFQEKDEQQSLGSAQLWSLLFTRETLREELNSWLTNKDKLKSHYKIKTNKKTRTIRFIDQRTNTEVSHKDMGVGVSQVLPILISSYFGRDKSIIIEQPELHLHPAVQAELGDEIIKSYKNANNYFFIETHSEYLLLRIMRRMRYVAENREDRNKKLDISPEDIAILYVDEEDETIFIRELRLANDGSLLDEWPGGFFEEGFKERFL